MSKSKNTTKSQRVYSKHIELMCYPQCMRAYHIWMALFFQLNERQKNYLFDSISKKNIDIPIFTTDKPDQYFFSNHFIWIYTYFYNKNNTKFQFRAYEKNDSYEFIIQALNEVRTLLCSSFYPSIKGLDIIAYLLNEQYAPAHLHEVFGHRSLSHELLRELTGLSKFKSPASSIAMHAGPLSLEKILAGI